MVQKEPAAFTTPTTKNNSQVAPECDVDLGVIEMADTITRVTVLRSPNLPPDTPRSYNL